MAALLLEAAVIISSFRNRNAASGYQLREPPGTDAILTRIDKLVHADNPVKEISPLVRKRKKRTPEAPGYEIQRAHPRSNFETENGVTIPRLAR